jgi:hypothetical protein
MMTWERVRFGLVSGVVGFTPLLLVVILSDLQLVTGDGAVTVALIAFVASIVLAGGMAGWLAGQGKRRRREAKVVVGGMAGIVAAATYCIILEGFYLIRAAQLNPGNALAIHPVRVTFAIVLMGTLIVAVAMGTTHFTAKRLPPPRPGRRATGYMPAVHAPPQEVP